MRPIDGEDLAKLGLGQSFTRGAAPMYMASSRDPHPVETFTQRAHALGYLLCSASVKLISLQRRDPIDVLYGDHIAVRYIVIHITQPCGTRHQKSHGIRLAGPPNRLLR